MNRYASELGMTPASRVRAGGRRPAAEAVRRVAGGLKPVRLRLLTAEDIDRMRVTAADVQAMLLTAADVRAMIIMEDIGRRC